jgi:TPP-dependent pyruvate/acetoin dehydrogenase alpha subunit
METKCPIRRFKQVLVDAGVMTSAEVEAIDQAAKAASMLPLKKR